MRILLLPLLLPAAIIFSAISYLRGRLFDLKLFSTVGFDTPVISVGNITSGGTGKTPITRWLAELLLKRGKKVAVLSRGYGRRSQDILKVDASSNDAERYGDEPLELAKNLDGVSVFVGSDRAASMEKILREEKPDVVLLDDGFQHRRLRRNLDFVLLDATQPWWQYLPLPLGYAREGMGALRRASAILHTKTNLSTSKKSLGTRPNFYFSSEVNHVRDYRNNKMETRFLEGKRVALLSGIAHPQVFEDQLRALGLNIVFHKRFPDHHLYLELELQDFLKSVEESGAEILLTTEKDAVKLAQFPWFENKYSVVELNIQLLGNQEEFHQVLDRIFT